MHAAWADNGGMRTPAEALSPPPAPLPRPRLVLASTSRYRQELLGRLRLPFTVEAPGVDETALPGEGPRDIALRLAECKAQEVARRQGDDVVVIGSDQVAELHGQPLGKPGGHEAAVRQLAAMSGQMVQFHTAVTVLRPAAAYAETVASVVSVQFRSLDLETIDTYLRLEQPYDCAGSAKVEGLGIALLASVHSDDPTSLIGLPLIALSRMLRIAGLDALRSASASPA